MKQYRRILERVLEEGTVKPNRTGEDTFSLFHHSYVLDLRDGFPLLTGKKINFDNILFELLWFLGGDSSPTFLHKHGIRFWDDWIEEDGNLPEAYGQYWRGYTNWRWLGDERTDPYSQEYVDVGFDQFEAIIEELKTNPNSRRMVLTNWYPPSAWNAKLPPCHLMCIFNVQYEIDGTPYLNLEMLQRSCDVPVGVPFNIASYALLLELVGHMVDLPVRYFAHTLVDVHIYKNQLDGVNEYLTREIRRLPTLVLHDDIRSLKTFDTLIKNGSTEQIQEMFALTDYNPQPFIKFPIMV